MSVPEFVAENAAQLGARGTMSVPEFVAENAAQLGAKGVSVSAISCAAAADLSDAIMSAVMRPSSLMGVTHALPSHSTRCMRRKEVRFVMGPEQQAAVDKLKNILCNAQVMAHPDWKLPFIVRTDASAGAIGAVLSQKQADGERPICFLSRSLTTAERNYHTTEREMLALVWGLQELRPYLFLHQFTVYTNHAAVVFFRNSKIADGSGPLSGRLARWKILLSSWDCEVQWKAGSKMIDADALSRTAPQSEALASSTALTDEDGIEFPPTDMKLVAVLSAQEEEAYLCALFAPLTAEPVSAATRNFATRRPAVQAPTAAAAATTTVPAFVSDNTRGRVHRRPVTGTAQEQGAPTPPRVFVHNAEPLDDWQHDLLCTESIRAHQECDARTRQEWRRGVNWSSAKVCCAEKCQQRLNHTVFICANACKL
eukprot:TRINITY_DN912_c0_g2_i1.p1 TRINITY_DN912_c0_g2~~TRINITY_DN912_c0_g2_i1.p1  ORF type:complete len:443 (+),score=83.09 TRINITY_DN912_c0_g2_i1:52-1329(+)